MKMKIIPNPGRLLAACFSVALALASTAADAQNPLTPRGGPLPETVEGQPIDSTQTESALLNYIDQQVQGHTQVIAPTGTYNAGTGIYTVTSPARLMTPGNLPGLMTPIVAKFGAKNLAAAHKSGASVRQGDLADYLVDQFKTYENSIIDAALAIAAEHDDISVVVDAAQDDDVDKDQTTLLMVVLRRATGNDPKVNSLVIDKLGSTTSYGTSAMALYHYAIISPDPAVQKKMADSLRSLMNSNSFSTQSLADSATNASTGADTAVNQLMIDAVTAQNMPCLVVFPNWVKDRATEWKKEAESDTPGASSNGQLRSILSQLLPAMSSHPSTFTLAPIDDGLGTLLTLLKRAPTYGAEYDFIAAATGDKAACQELLPFVNPVAVGAGATLNGFPAGPNSSASRYAQDLLQLVTYQGSGDKLTSTLHHLDTASYANGQWTVTDSSAAKNPTTTAATALAAPGSNPSPLASTAPVTSATPAAAPAPPATAGPVTATVTTATKIEAQTPQRWPRGHPLGGRKHPHHPLRQRRWNRYGPNQFWIQGQCPPIRDSGQHR